MKYLKRPPATTLTRLQPVSARLYRVPGSRTGAGRRANKSGYSLQEGSDGARLLGRRYSLPVAVR